MSDLPDYVLQNRRLWDDDAINWVESGERHWAEEPSWGTWGIPETELGLLPDDMSGMDAIELGCGTAYVSAWMARRGGRCVGIDNSEKQLETATRLAGEHGIDLELIHGNAEDVPLPDASFDFAISEYGAAIWADPYKWVPEAWRLIRAGGSLVFLGNHPLMSICQSRIEDIPVGTELLYPYFGMHRIDWDDGTDQGTEFNLPVAEWMRLFDEVGFDVVAYHELRSPKPGDEVEHYRSADWSHSFPAEQAWNLRKRR